MDIAIQQTAARIRLLALDVDGVLTDGKLYFSADGDELKAFNILDGHGIKMLHQAGIMSAIITGRSSPLTQRRAENLGIRWLYQGREDKKKALDELATESGVGLAEMAYAGDDLPDLAAIQAVGLGISVPNGYPAVIESADWCTRAAGGSGAVREICDLLLSARNELNSQIQSYRQT